MSIPKDLMYTKSHEWVKFINDTTAVVGLTDHAQEALGDIVFINLPLVGDDLNIGDSFSDVESVKAVSDVYSPVSGTVLEINNELINAPELINEGPYEAWLVKIKDITEQDELITAEAYAQLLAEEV
ncbi:MAG: glycine cleavage system protein GcvH [Vallitaleaceae bacterium]|nr:glycine cleavage system protein GcvH [Vallitaleaceae bacterium]